MLQKAVRDREVKQQSGAEPGQNEKWTLEPSPAGNSMKYFKRPSLTVKNHKIIKLSWRNEKELLYLAKASGNKSPGPHFQMSRHRLRDLGSVHC